MLRIKCFLRFLIAKTRPKYKKNHQLGYIHWVYIHGSRYANNMYVEGCFLKSNFMFSLQLNLAKSSCGSQPLHVTLGPDPLHEAAQYWAKWISHQTFVSRDSERTKLKSMIPSLTWALTMSSSLAVRQTQDTYLHWFW